MTLCRCPTPEAARQCRRAGVTMHPPLHALCQSRADYRELWDKIAAGEQTAPQPAPDGAVRLKTCAARTRGAVRGPHGRPLHTLDTFG